MMVRLLAQGEANGKHTPKLHFCAIALEVVGGVPVLPRLGAQQGNSLPVKEIEGDREARKPIQEGRRTRWLRNRFHRCLSRDGRHDGKNSPTCRTSQRSPAAAELAAPGAAPC